MESRFFDVLVGIVVALGRSGAGFRGAMGVIGVADREVGD